MPEGICWRTWIKYDPQSPWPHWSAEYHADWLLPVWGVRACLTRRGAERQARRWARKFSKMKEFNNA